MYADYAPSTQQMSVQNRLTKWKDMKVLTVMLVVIFTSMTTPSPMRYMCDMAIMLDKMSTGTVLKQEQVWQVEKENQKKIYGMELIQIYKNC